MCLSGKSLHGGLSSSTNSIIMHILIISLWLIVMLGILFIAWEIVQHQQRQRTSKKSHLEARQRQYHIQELIRQAKERAKRRRRTAPQSKKSKTRPESVDPRLWKQLLTMLRGDQEAAKRLINHERRRNPDKSEKWLLEKAIWQLQRDRR